MDNDIVTDAVERVGRAEQVRIERAIRGAIRSGYDGVDFDYPEYGTIRPHITPWNYPPPESDNGMLTRRYTWDWFSDDELTQLLVEEDW